MPAYDPKNLREIKKIYFLVHPFWGYYTKTVLDGKIVAGPIYSQMLEVVWNAKLFKTFFKNPETGQMAGEKVAELMKRAQREKWGQDRFLAEFAVFLRQNILQHHATEKETEVVLKEVGKRYRSAVDEAAKGQGAVFLSISFPSSKITKIKSREHEYGLQRYIKEKLGKRAIIQIGEVKPVKFFQLLAGRGFKLGKSIEIESFGEVAVVRSGKACVPFELGKLIAEIPRLRKSVENGAIFNEKPLSKKTDSRTTVAIPKGVKLAPWRHIKISHLLGIRDNYWINLSRSGIPLRGIKRLARKIAARRKRLVP